jgi:hypothetical protein
LFLQEQIKFARPRNSCENCRNAFGNCKNACGNSEIPETRVETPETRVETPETRVETPDDLSGDLATPVEKRAKGTREIRKLKMEKEKSHPIGNRLY